MTLAVEVDSLASRFERVLGASRVLADPALVEPYGRDATHLQGRPVLVVQPKATEEVAAAVRIAAEARLPLIPRGAGTNLSGGLIPTEEGREVVLDMAAMSGPVDVDVVYRGHLPPQQQQAVRDSLQPVR